jgi:hypothetical protein
MQAITLESVHADLSGVVALAAATAIAISLQ